MSRLPAFSRESQSAFLSTTHCSPMPVRSLSLQRTRFIQHPPECRGVGTRIPDTRPCDLVSLKLGLDLLLIPNRQIYVTLQILYSSSSGSLNTRLKRGRTSLAISSGVCSPASKESLTSNLSLL